MRELRNEIAIRDKRIIELEAENRSLRSELRGVAHRRETTSQKINMAVERRFAVLTWYRDRILTPTIAAVHTVIVMAILYLSFGGKLP